jgi:hypothetical protein
MIRVVFSPVFLNEFFFQGMPMAQGMASGIVHSNLNQGLSGGYDSDAEGGNHQGNIGGSFGEKAVSIFFIYLKKHSTDCTCCDFGHLLFIQIFYMLQCHFDPTKCALFCGNLSIFCHRCIRKIINSTNPAIYFF